MPRKKNGEDELQRDVNLVDFERAMREAAPETKEEREGRERQYRRTPLYIFQAYNYLRDPEIQRNYAKAGGVKRYLSDVVRSIKEELKSRRQSEALAGMSLDEYQVPYSEEDVRRVFSQWKENEPQWYEENDIEGYLEHILKNERYPRPAAGPEREASGEAPAETVEAEAVPAETVHEPAAPFAEDRELAEAREELSRVFEGAAERIAALEPGMEIPETSHLYFMNYFANPDGSELTPESLQQELRTQLEETEAKLKKQGRSRDEIEVELAAERLEWLAPRSRRELEQFAEASAKGNVVNLNHYRESLAHLFDGIRSGDLKKISIGTPEPSGEPVPEADVVPGAEAATDEPEEVPDGETAAEQEGTPEEAGSAEAKDYRVVNNAGKPYLGVQVSVKRGTRTVERQYAGRFPRGVNSESPEVQEAVRELLVALLRESGGYFNPEISYQADKQRLVFSREGRRLFTAPFAEVAARIAEKEPSLAGIFRDKYPALKSQDPAYMSSENAGAVRELERSILRNSKLNINQRALDAELQRRWEASEFAQNPDYYSPEPETDQPEPETAEKVSAAVREARSLFDANGLTLAKLRELADSHEVPSAAIAEDILKSTGNFSQFEAVRNFVRKGDVPHMPWQVLERAVDAVQQQRMRGIDRNTVAENTVVEITEGFEGKPYGLDWNPYTGAYFLRSKLGETPEGEEDWYRIVVPAEVDVQEPQAAETLHDVFQKMVADNGGLSVGVQVREGRGGRKLEFGLAGEKALEVPFEDALYAGAGHDPIAWGEKYLLADDFLESQQVKSASPDQPLNEAVERGASRFAELVLTTRERGKMNYLHRARNRAFAERVRRQLRQKP